MLQCSHHTLNSVLLIPAFSTFVICFWPRSSRPAAFESVKRPRRCNLPGAGIRPGSRSAQVFQPALAELLLHYGPEQIESAIGTSDIALRDTTSCRLWTIGKYACFMNHNEVRNTRQLPEQQKLRSRYISVICPWRLPSTEMKRVSEVLQLAIEIQRSWPPSILETQLS